jgi:hypothetical protein
MFSPLGYPAGMIIYDLATSLPPQSHLSLSPFELHREPLAIIAVADGKELDHYTPSTRNSFQANGDASKIRERNIRELDQALEVVRDQYPKALVHQLLLFDYMPTSTLQQLPDGLIGVPAPEDSKLTTMKTIMCDISSLLLAEMTSKARSYQGQTIIESPNNGQGARLNDYYAWPTGDDMHSRRNSQYGAGSRNESPAGKTDRSTSRMSMPVLRRTTSDAVSNLSTPRPGSPMSGFQIENDSRPGSVPPGLQAPDRDSLSRVASGDSFRSHSRDRISVHGFGSASLSEKSRTKAKGRVGIVIGSLYLQAGRWTDALRELSEGAHIAHSNSDHLWHAKALENIVVAMLMLCWAGVEFQIPQVCYVAADRAPYHTGAADQTHRAASWETNLQNLASLLTDLVEKIISRYTRVTGESLPQLPFSEIVVRLSNLLTVLHLAGGQLNHSALQAIVNGAPLKPQPNVDIPRLSVQPARTSIVNMLFRAFPQPTAAEDLSVADRITILAGIASVLGYLGAYRKKAFVMREILAALIPSLIQARKLGAAEMGIHPAAGLAALNDLNGGLTGAGAFELGQGDVENGVDDLLEVMCRIYGTVNSRPIADNEDTKLHATTFEDSRDGWIQQIMSNSALRRFGSRNLKMNVLRTCINLSEALPDFPGVLRFSSDLLRTAGKGIAPGPRSEDASPTMPREEQIRLATNITRTVAAARKLGLHTVEAEYWDDFLVRGVEVEPLPSHRMAIPHKKTELGATAATSESRKKNPFIYNPFLKRPDTANVEHLLVANEAVMFKITLQNPYEMDVDIESIKLEAIGAEFVSDVQSTVIGSYQTQIMSIHGTPRAAGSLTVTGCLIKIRGCRERRFPIFAKSWSPQGEIKVKAHGLEVLRSGISKPGSMQSAAKTPTTPPTAPKPTHLTLNVIDEQPMVVVKSSTAPQSAAMVLEGERQQFSITLQNVSTTLPVDLILFSFQDSTQGAVQAALSRRDASPAELYEYELILSKKPALRWIKQDDIESPTIPPNSTATFDFELLGKPGLTNGVVQVDYAHLGVTAAEMGPQFHTHKVSIPLTMTVNASIELSRIDILPLMDNIPAHFWPDKESSQQATGEEYCLLLLDLRNAWPAQLQIHLNLPDNHTIEESILPGSTSRIIFPFKRILLSNPYAPIPSLDPKRQRQYVVSTSNISPDLERAGREAFWYREEILKAVSGTWRTVLGHGRGRSGAIELRGIRLTPRMIDTIRVEDVGISVRIEGPGAKAVGDHMFLAPVDEFLTCKVSLKNRTQRKIYPLLRLQPSLRHHAQSVALDLSRRLVWDGTLQHTLPPLEANEVFEVTLGVTALCRGEFEFSASVEETKLEEVDDLKSVGRQRSNTQTLVDVVLKMRERRIWHSRTPCILVATEEDSSDEA